MRAYHVNITPKELIKAFFCVSLEREVWVLPNTIECNNNASQKCVSTVYIIRGQLTSLLVLIRYHCAEGLALQCFSL